MKKIALKVMAAAIQWLTIIVFAFLLGIASSIIWTVFKFGWDLL
jgi:hypothetical protein